MAQESPISREAFLDLAKEAGLDTSSPHMDQLYRYTQNLLGRIQSLKELDLSNGEPDMAFVPARSRIPHEE
ncbi:MAG: hypothetical protein ACE5Q6_03410 [Dehalococcoidia bacterium]